MKRSKEESSSKSSIVIRLTFVRCDKLWILSVSYQPACATNSHVSPECRKFAANFTWKVMSKVKIGLVQMSCTADKEANLQKAIREVKAAATRGARIVCLQ